MTTFSLYAPLEKRPTAHFQEAFIGTLHTDDRGWSVWTVDHQYATFWDPRGAFDGVRTIACPDSKTLFEQHLPPGVRVCPRVAR